MKLQSCSSLGWIVLAAFLAGCGKGEIRTYRIPKDKPTVQRAEVAAPRSNPDTNRPRITYGNLPPGWQEAAATQMRAASFIVTGKGGGTADFSVIPLVGVNAQDSDIINIWRDQLKLMPLTTDATPQEASPVMVGSLSAKLYDMVSATPLTNETSRTRIVVAMLQKDATRWVFKMVGPDELVADQKPVFIEFLKTVKLEEPQAQRAMPVATSPPSTAPGPVASQSADGVSKWDVPAHWGKGAPTGVSLATFVAGDKAAGAPDVTVTVLGSAGGGALMNVNRWRAQLALGEVGDSQLASVTTPLGAKVPGGLLVDFTGAGEKSRTRIVAAIVPRGSKTWFFKLIGDAAAVGKEKDGFVNFVQSVQYADNR